MSEKKVYTSHNTTLEYTGERMVPEKAQSTTFWEHIYRYRFASYFVKNKRVLDIACGEGYGSAALLRAGASSVVGIDISVNTCRHARQKYGVDICSGDARRIPLQNGVIDVIVSFETIEHMGQPEQFLSECKRVLTPDGLLIISTPNRDVYSADGQHNPFHEWELNKAEFTNLLNKYFSNLQLYSQLPDTVGWWSVRSLAARNTNWVNIKGFWRIRDMLRHMSPAYLSTIVEENMRKNPAQTILGEDPILGSLVNPYIIRRMSSIDKEAAMYLLAVARG